MARTACGKNGNTADPSSHGHSSPILLPQPDSVDLLCGLPIVKIRFAAECSILRRISKLEKEYPFSFVDLRERTADWPGQLSHL